MHHLTTSVIITAIALVYSPVPSNSLPTQLSASPTPQTLEHNFEANEKFVVSPKDEQTFEEVREPPPAPKRQTNEERALKEVSKALELMLSVMEKIVIVVAVFAFLFVQYIVFKLLDYLHRRIQRRKILKREAKKNANSQEMKSAPQKY